MPIHDFQCDSCGLTFEELVRSGETPDCPRCGAAGPRRLLSQVAPSPRIGLRGADARRSDATRKVREERKREQRAAKRERDRKG